MEELAPWTAVESGEMSPTYPTARGSSSAQLDAEGERDTRGTAPKPGHFRGTVIGTELGTGASTLSAGKPFRPGGHSSAINQVGETRNASLAQRTASEIVRVRFGRTPGPGSNSLIRSSSWIIWFLARNMKSSVPLLPIRRRNSWLVTPSAVQALPTCSTD